MTRLAQLRGILLSLLALGAIGMTACYGFYSDDHNTGYWYFCDSSGCYLCDWNGCEGRHNYDGTCSANDDCTGQNATCDYYTGKCRTDAPASGCAVSADCGSGYSCIDKTCVPQRSSCQSDPACGDGACCNNGSCENTGLCQTDAECAAFGDNRVCDARGSCVVGTSPVQACSEANQCAEGICLEGVCASCAGDCGAAKSCLLDAHCGEGKVCLDGQCSERCAADFECGTGQGCQLPAGICLNRPAGTCSVAGECGAGELCLNNQCYADCSESGVCGNSADICSGNVLSGSQSVKVCLPDTRAKPQCALNKDCVGGEQCVNGICRTACLTDTDCAVCEDGPVCAGGGFCMTAAEANPTCKTTADCPAGSGLVCLSSQCTNL